MKSQIPKAPQAYDQRNEQLTRTAIEREFEDTSRPVATYQVDSALSAAATRALSPSSTIDDIRLVLATLLADLKIKGIIK